MSEEKRVYNYDPMGFYSGSAIADRSPLESDVYLIPPQATLVEPPPAEDGKLPRWNGSQWQLVATQVGSDEVAVNKLTDFLRNNPDVAALLNK